LFCGTSSSKSRLQTVRAYEPVDRNRRARHIQSCPGPIHTAGPDKKTKHWDRTQDARSPLAVDSPPGQKNSPEFLWPSRLLLGQTGRDGDRRMPLPRLSVSPFVVAQCTAPPAHANVARLPCRTSRPASRQASTQAPLPHGSISLKTPHRPNEAPGTSPAAAVVPALVMVFA